MKRRPLNLLTTGSLLLCVAACGLWVRSHWVSDALMYGGASGEYGTQTMSGTLALVQDNTPHAVPSLRQDRFDARQISPWDNGSPLSLPNRLGFGYRVDTVPAGKFRLADDTTVTVPPARLSRMVLLPLWLPALLFALAPAARLYRRLRPRYAAGRCATCGYDLRATPDQCPECGATPPTPVHPRPQQPRSANN
jgi:hypothetical protein